MEPGIRDESGIPGKTALVNGSVDDESPAPPPLIKRALSLDAAGDLQPQSHVESPPVGTGSSETLLPALSNRSSPLTEGDATLLTSADTALSDCRPTHRDYSAAKSDGHAVVQRTAAGSLDDQPQTRNEIVDTIATSADVPASRAGENHQTTSRAAFENPPTGTRHLNANQKCAGQGSNVNTTQSAIGGDGERVRVVDAGRIPMERSCGTPSPATSSPRPPRSLSDALAESVEAAAEEMDADVEEAKTLAEKAKSEGARPSPLSTPSSGAFGQTKSQQSETTCVGPTTGSPKPPTSSSGSPRPSAAAAAHAAGSSKPAAAPNQKSSSKPRGNAMIYVPDLSEELLQGYRILTEIFGDKCKSFVWPFLDPVDTAALWDYEAKIKHPMWLRKIESKFVNKEYRSIAEFAVDVRQMLENCYRYNGMKHQISKYAQTLECVFEQKLALLSRPLQEKTTLYVTSNGKYNDGCPGTVELSSGRLRRSCTRLASRALEQQAAAPLAFHVRQELERQEREAKRQKIVDRRDEIIKERLDLLEWDKQLIGETHWTYMKSVWEIPAIGHFLCLCQSALELDEISFFELERCFAIPMESTIMRRIFTTLLSTPYQRTRLGKKPPMPYKVWEARLREWVRGWYVVLNKLGDTSKVYERIGVPERFFEVLGPHFPLDRVQYHQLAYYDRVWIMKALCDQLFETQMTVRRCVLSQPPEEQRPIVLGVDGEANSYIHFPQFCGADLRIYRQAKYPDLLKKARKDRVKTDDVDGATEEQSTPRPHRSRRAPAARRRTANPKPKPNVPETPRTRPSRLRQTLTTTVHYGTYAESVISSTESEDVTSEFTEMEGESESDCLSEVQAASNSQSECPVASHDQSEGRTLSGGQSRGCPTSNGPAECPGSSHEPQDEAEPMDVPEKEDVKHNAFTDSGHTLNKGRAKEECEKVRESLPGEKKHQPSLTTEVVKREQMLADDSLSSRVDDLPAKLKPDSSEQLCNGETISSRSSTTSETDSLEAHPRPGTEQETKGGIATGADKCTSPSVDNGTSSQSSDFGATAEHSIKAEGDQEGARTSEGQNTNNNSSQTLDIDRDVKSLVDPSEKPRDDIAPTGAEDAALPASPPPPHQEVLPILGEFELVCDSMESLKELVDRFGPPESKPLPPTTGRKRKAAAYVKQPVRKRCERELHEKLTNLLLELTPYEAKLAKFAMRNRERFKKDYEAAQTVPETDQDIKDIWASEESSSNSSSDTDLESEDEEQAGTDTDEDWDASTEGMKLRKRIVKKSAASAAPGADEEEAGEAAQEDLPRKPKRPRPSGRRSPPHKNQLNTSLMGLLKGLPADGLKDACKRLQTMIKRAEASRNHMFQKSKINPASLSGCWDVDGQAVIAFLNKAFWVGAKPPAVEGNVATTVGELISTYPTFVHNLIFRNLKGGLSKLSSAAKSTSADSTDKTNEPESKEEPDAPEHSEPSQEASQLQSADGQNAAEELTSSSRIETRSTTSITSQENGPNMESKTKTKDVMDDFTLAGLYTVLTETKRILRERLATGLSELLPDYPTLQESVVHVDSSSKNDQRDSVLPILPSSRSETDKELLLKMLPKPSQYLKGPKSVAESSSHVSHVKYIASAEMGSIGNSIKPCNSLIVPVNTSKLPFMPRSRSNTEAAKAGVPATTPPHTSTQATATTGHPQPSENPGAVPHGVYTIKVDASVWSQLQGKPELQQQFVLQQIKEMRRKQGESGSLTPTAGSLSNPAQSVTCIRSPPKAQATAPRTSSQTRPAGSPARNTGRISQTVDLQSIADLSSLQPIKLSKPARPKVSAKHRGGLPESASNLSQRELIALLQQQQRQLELHRQQQQQKQLLKQKSEQQPQQVPPPQQQQTHTQQQAKQQFVLSASGALLLSPQGDPQTGAVTDAPNTPITLSVGNTSPSVVPSSSQGAPLLASRPTHLSTKTTVTAAVKQPKMTANLKNPQPGVVPPSAATVLSQIGQQPQSVQQAQVPQIPAFASNPPTSPGSRLHLVQTNNGAQFIVRTGAVPGPRLPGLSSAGIIPNPGSTFSAVMAGQKSQAASEGVSSASSTVLAKALPQTVQFVMHPNQAVTDTANCEPKVVLGSSTYHLGQATASVCPVGATQAGPQANQDAQRRTNDTATNRNAGQLAQAQRQAAPAVIPKPQLTVVGDSKVIIGSPTKVVRLVQPSHLSTAATFVPTSAPGQVGTLPVVVSQAVQVVPQGMQVLAQVPAQQQLVHPTAQAGKMESAPGVQGSPSVSGTVIQEHLQQVVLQQLAAGKLKLTPQTIPVSQIVRQQAPTQQPKAAQLVNTIPVVLSQQAPQILTKLQQPLPAAVKTSTPIAGADALLDQQLRASVQLITQSKTGQGPAVSLLAAPSAASLGKLPGQEPQRLQLVSPASSVAGAAHSVISVPAVQKTPTQLAVQASQLVLAQPSVNSQVLRQTVPTQVILQTESSQLMAAPLNALPKGVKRPSLAPVVLDCAAKVPRVAGTNQVTAAQAVPASTSSGFPQNTSKGMS